jgi:hypothetical protein
MTALVVNDKLGNELAAHPIPPMTHPDGRYWDQPDRALITVDAVHALMTRATFLELADYSGTFPSGVYEGKMWRRLDGSFDRAFLARGGRPVWQLCWYGPSQIGPGYCSNHRREILLADADIKEEK